MKNIVIACDYAYIEGGAAKVAIKTAVALSQYDDVKVYFVAGSGEPCDELKNSKVEVLSLGLYDLLGNPSKFNACINGIFNDEVYVRVSKFFNTLNANETILHIHTWTKVLSSAIFKAANDNNIQIFLTVHDYFLVCPNGGCFNYVKNEICNLMPLSMSCLQSNCDVRNYGHKLWRCLRQIKQNSIISRIGNINYIFVSEFQRNELFKRIHSIHNSYILKNPIECGERYRVKAEENRIFLFIGRLSEEKGILAFCKAVTEANVEAIVIGDGKLRKSLEEKYNNIIFTGWLSKIEMQSWIEKARCLVFPSLWYEGSPLTVPEVQAYGVPCIVASTCAATDDITPQNGLIFDVIIEDLIGKIMFMNDDGVVRKFSENTYSGFDCSRVDVEVYLKKLRKIYDI